MRFLFLMYVAVVIGGAGRGGAETFIGPTTPENRLIIATNEVILLRQGIMPDAYLNLQLTIPEGSFVFQTQIHLRDAKNKAIPGPAELITTNACAVSFTRVSGVDVGRIAWAVGDTNVFEINIKEGDTLQFFPSLITQWNLRLVRLSRGTNVFAAAAVGIAPPESFTLDGPLTIAWPNISTGTTRLEACYWNVNKVFMNPETIVAGNATTHAIVVEKSGNMTNWQAVATMPITVGSNAFYRLKLNN